MSELKPLFRRYWVKVLDNNRCIAQFDHEGNYVLWNNDISCKRVLFVPFSIEFANICKSKGNNCEISNLPVLEFEANNNVKYYRNCTIKHDVSISCHFCGYPLEFGDIQCPRCFGKNWYYCDRCDSLKDNPIIKLELIRKENEELIIKWIEIAPNLLMFLNKLIKNLPEKWGIRNTQVLCPDCDEPRGLMSVGCLMEDVEENLRSIHVLEIDNEKRLILDSMYCG